MDINYIFEYIRKAKDLGSSCKNILFILIILVLNCNAKPRINIKSHYDCWLNKDMIFLGSKNNKNEVWIFLCGLTNDFYNQYVEKNRLIIDKIGKKLNIEIIAIEPPIRSEYFNNCLNWPHNSFIEVLGTFYYILNKIGNRKILGFIGFSNGGYFLNRLVQELKIGFPCISIGSGGQMYNPYFKNNLVLLIGKKDKHNYKWSKKFYSEFEKKRDKGNLKFQYIEFEGGHEIPQEILTKFILTYGKKSY